MKLSSAAIFLLLSLSSLSSVSAKPKDNNKKKGENKGNDKKPPVSPDDDHDDDDDVELVVRYKKGTHNMKLQANDGTGEKVVSERYNVAMLKTKRSNMAQIENDPDVEAVAESKTYYALPYTCGGQAQDERNLVDLDEVPY